MKTINWILIPGQWQRGTDIDELLKRCKKAWGLKTTDTYVRYIGVIKNEATQEQVENLQKCWNVNDFGGLNTYHPLSKEDQEMMDKYFVGWITEVYNEKKKDGKSNVKNTYGKR